MDAVIYARSASDDDDGFSTGVQIERCRVLATVRGYNIVAVYEDRGCSGLVADNPQFTLMMATIIQESSTVKAIVVVNVDRLTRNAAL